jgi:hypothetical protein
MKRYQYLLSKKNILIKTKISEEKKWKNSYISKMKRLINENEDVELLDNVK